MTLANKIVETWPQLAQNFNPDRPPAFLFFNCNGSSDEKGRKNAGMIENRVDRLMRKLPQERRRYAKRRKVSPETEAAIEKVRKTYKKNKFILI